MSTYVLGLPKFLLQLMAIPKLPHFTRIGPEDLETIKLANELRARTLDGTLRAVWFHVPNEGKRSVLQGMLGKAKGLIPGTPDFIFLAKNRSFCLELKVNGGRQTETQRNFETWCKERGVPYVCVQGYGEARAALVSWGLL